MAEENDYTPHGYLDLPDHAWRLHPLGVLRSEGAGFLWHFPAYAGGYGGRQEQYRAGFQLCLNGAREIADFDKITCPYHTKNLLQFNLHQGKARAEARFHPVGAHTLRCKLTVSGAGPARVGVHVRYERLLGATGAWGESGLVGRREGDHLVLQGFESGEVFLLACSHPADRWAIGADPAGLDLGADPAPTNAEPTCTVVGRAGETVALHAALGFALDLDGTPQTIEITLTRGLTVPRARAELNRAQAQAGREEARRRASDGRFWEGGPRLRGDWPDHWRRGIVYDLETVRMMVKPPVGIYHYPWDAMQIQAPRVVLAEAAIDALLLSYAEPRTAQQLLLGTFADAPAPNVPCSREDGSYNMVSAEGVACGTSPAWGYPWLAVEHLAALHTDRGWIAQIYPYLGAYLDWWLQHRRDEAGWLVYACSWEAGQDGSPRFGEQPLGEGSPTWHIRPVDLQAAFAHAAQVMARLAERLERTQDQVKWTTLGIEYSARTDRLWDKTHYADYDTQAGRFSDVQELMHLAPLALWITRPEHAAVSLGAIEGTEADALTWPMFAWTATEAALRTGCFDKAAELAWAVCERAYRFWDARRAHPERTLPGIACEYWPPSGKCGGEGYGWGAFTTHLALHVLVGLSFSFGHLFVRPNLPPHWREAGRRYELQWRCRGRPLQIALEPLGTKGVRVSLNGRPIEVGWGERLVYPWSSPSTTEDQA